MTINANGSYTYTPSANYIGTDSFTYKVIDANGATATGTVQPDRGGGRERRQLHGHHRGAIVVDPRTNDAIVGGYKNATVTAINGTSISSGQTITLSSGTT